MHPEVKMNHPGSCPKCGMQLVPEDAAVKPIFQDKGLGKLTIKNYIPLIVVVSMILTVSLLISFNDYKIGTFSVLHLISYFMTGFFIVFSSFKLMDLQGFAQGYFTYDLLAKKVFWYGYLYPFIELAFGLLMLMSLGGKALLLLEIIVMAFSGLGILFKMLKKEKINCVCLGTFLKVPLTNITLLEDFGMAALALILFIYGVR